MANYFDKHGRKLNAGDKIRHDSGIVETLYLTINDNIGINASTEKFIKKYGESAREIYPLSEFDLSEWEKI